MLRRFHAEEARAPWTPTAVEQEFAFVLERNRVQGRYDLVIERDGQVTIVDFKTGDVRDAKAAQKRAAREPAARHLRPRAPARPRAACPTGSSCASWSRASSAARRPTAEEAVRTAERIRVAAAAIRAARVPGPAHLAWRAASARSATSAPTRRWGGEAEA